MVHHLATIPPARQNSNSKWIQLFNSLSLYQGCWVLIEKDRWMPGGGGLTQLDHHPFSFPLECPHPHPPSFPLHRKSIPPANEANLSSCADHTTILFCIIRNLASPINYALSSIFSTSPILPASSHWFLYTLSLSKGIFLFLFLHFPKSFQGNFLPFLVVKYFKQIKSNITDIFCSHTIFKLISIPFQLVLMFSILYHLAFVA